jgi:hypothetical protein
MEFYSVSEVDFLYFGQVDQANRGYYWHVGIPATRISPFDQGNRLGVWRGGFVEALPKNWTLAYLTS